MNDVNEIMKRIAEGKGLEPIDESSNKPDSQTDCSKNLVGTRLECLSADEALKNKDRGK